MDARSRLQQLRLLRDVGLSADDVEFREFVAGLVRKEIAPRARQIDEEERFPSEAMAALAAAELLGLLVPTDLGGTGATKLKYVIAVEEIGLACGATAATFMTHAHGSLPVLLAGSADQKRRWLPGLCRGEHLGAIAFTEPSAGSDLGSLRLRARKTDHDTYRLDGHKIFVTNGGHAEFVVGLARTSPDSSDSSGLSTIVVEGHPAGLARSKPMAKMGIRGSSTVELFFDGVEVPVANLLGREGEGFKIAMQTLDGARLSTAAQALGLAQGALDRAVEYAADRRQFGRPISSFQAVSFKLVDMFIAVASARALLYDVARLVDSKAPRDLVTGLAAIAKTTCSDVAMWVTTEAVQVFGGYGYIRDNEIERYMRDAKITQIYDGSNELNRVVAARSLGLADE